MADRAQLDRWMAAAADGDRATIDPLFHALLPLVTGYAARLLGDAALAEDCAQDALIQLFGQIDRYDRTRDALTWALTHTTVIGLVAGGATGWVVAGRTAHV